MNSTHQNEYVDWYAKGPYQGFLHELRVGGDSGIGGIVAQQPAGDYPDPASDTLGLVMNIGRRAAKSTVDGGFGRYHSAYAPDTIALSAPNHAYDCTVDTDHRIMVMALPSHLLERLSHQTVEELTSTLEPLLSNDVQDGFLSSLVKRLWHEMASNSASGQLFIDGMAMAIVGALVRQAQDVKTTRAHKLSPKEIQVLVEFIECEMASDFSVSDLASLLDRPNGQFTAAFREAFNQSPHQYLLQRRIAAAQNLLTNTELSLAEVAYDCGFSSQQHMTNVFSKRVGITPGQHRGRSGS